MGRKSKHGMAKTRLYQIWSDMKQRCDNPQLCNYKHYGGRGITYCDEWHTFIPFMEWALANGYDSKLTLDRIDNNGNYCPSNCRFATKRVQNINKGTSRPNTSGYIGIRQHSSGKGWYGTVKIANKDYYTGYSLDLLTAVRLRNNYIIANNLENKLNEVKQ